MRTLTPSATRMRNFLLPLVLCAVWAIGSAQPVDDPRANHLGCRDEATPHIDELLDAAREKRGVVLYFHGGLSPPEYMEDDLGPWLLKSMFAAEGMSDFFPVFINYDAGLFQGMVEPVAKFREDDDITRAERQFQQLFPSEAELADTPEARAAAQSPTAQLG